MELIRLLLGHPYVELVSLVANSNAGQRPEDLYPHLRGSGLPALVMLAEVEFAELDVVFCCLPHGTSQEVIASIPENVVVIDLSADFRLRDASQYEKWYGKPHQAEHLQARAVYGLSEHYRDEITHAQLIACPGCYPTSALIPLIPLLKADVIGRDPVIIDAKSGVTGAGRKTHQSLLKAELHDNLKPYGLGGHRHLAEIEQELPGLACSFTPQIIPVSRGILATIYVTARDAAHIRTILQQTYSDEPFVQVSHEQAVTLRDAAYSNCVHISVHDDNVPERVIIVSAIDNLIKGASGQAVQNMNIRFGFNETLALPQLAIFP